MMHVDFLRHYPYWISLFLMMTGLYAAIASPNLIKKLIGLSIFQVSVLLFYISLGYVDHSVAPILRKGIRLYSNPLPQVLVLTAIVVGVATMAVGLAIILRIQRSYGTIDEHDIAHMNDLEEVAAYSVEEAISDAVMAGP